MDKHKWFGAMSIYQNRYNRGRLLISASKAFLFAAQAPIQIQPSKPKREITDIRNSQNTKRTARKIKQNCTFLHLQGHAIHQCGLNTALPA